MYHIPVENVRPFDSEVVLATMSSRYTRVRG